MPASRLCSQCCADACGSGSPCRASSPRWKCARLEIDDAQIHAGTIEFRQRIAPDVIEIDRPRDRAVDTLGTFHVGAGVTDVWFVQRGIGRMRQDLIDPAASHHVAAEEKSDRVRLWH
jgi:hypothetical protein